MVKFSYVYARYTILLVNKTKLKNVIWEQGGKFQEKKPTISGEHRQFKDNFRDSRLSRTTHEIPRLWYNARVCTVLHFCQPLA